MVRVWSGSRAWAGVACHRVAALLPLPRFHARRPGTLRLRVLRRRPSLPSWLRLIGAASLAVQRQVAQCHVRGIILTSVIYLGQAVGRLRVQKHFLGPWERMQSRMECDLEARDAG